MVGIFTFFSPKCWATSNTNLSPSLSTSKALRIGGKSPSNYCSYDKKIKEVSNEHTFTSTTAPIISVTTPFPPSKAEEVWKELLNEEVNNLWEVLNMLETNIFYNRVLIKSPKISEIERNGSVICVFSNSQFWSNSKPKNI